MPSPDPLQYFTSLSLPLAALHAAPFVLLLLLIAVLPLIPLTAHAWEKNRNKLWVSMLLGGTGLLMYALPTHDWAKVLHTAAEYAAFMGLVGSLFVISGGIHIRGAFAGFPWVNTVFLGLGAVLANLLGTTGASMLLIRPFLRANQKRSNKIHQVVFFIFVVSNCGGMLTPLGDPPLFMGFLRGVPFDWTLRFTREWGLTIGLLLFVFHILDERAFLREDQATKADLVDEVAGAAKKLHIDGKKNFYFLGGVLAVTLVSGYVLNPWLTRLWGAEHAALYGALFQAASMGLLAFFSHRFTAKSIHEANHFSFGPVLEVGALFAGIFAAMLPALALLSAKGPSLGLTQPWQYFWSAGLLSSFLDNAPTYLTFATLASSVSGLNPAHFGELAAKAPRLLEAISCGAVFMGANTYIGNGPNFMVKAIADHRGVKTPSFFGYMLWALCVLIPIFVLQTFLFF
jgi:Na+/H+ antiporter NhaD/arsenite permease-like protein